MVFGVLFLVFAEWGEKTLRFCWDFVGEMLVFPMSKRK